MAPIVVADLDSYLSFEYGICINDEVIAHLLWADDLALFSDTVDGLQKQLNGLKQFCLDNHMIVNEIKTKYMVFGNLKIAFNLTFDAEQIAKVNEYKYLGNIIASIKQARQDPFMKTYTFLSDQARRATFSMSCKIKNIGQLPPDIMLNLFDALVKPILTYGSDVWGFKTEIWGVIDKVFLQYSRRLLHVKATTSNVITSGECGRLPPSTTCQISALRYINRLYHMPNDKLAKKVYNYLIALSNQGFTTWATHILNLADDLGLDIGEDENKFANECKRAIRNKFILTWFENLHNCEMNPILRTYRCIKIDFVIEPYLYLVKKPQYRQAIAKFRCSSHTLEIERGRHSNPRTPVRERLCRTCNAIEDEMHFLLKCKINQLERNAFFHEIKQLYAEFVYLDDRGKFHYIMTSHNPQCLTWLGKFLNTSFMKRNQLHCHE